MSVCVDGSGNLVLQSGSIVTVPSGVYGQWWANNSPFNTPIPSNAFANPMPDSATAVNQYFNAGGNITDAFRVTSNTFTACLIVAPAGTATGKWDIVYNGNWNFPLFPLGGGIDAQIGNAWNYYATNGDSDKSMNVYSTDQNVMYDIYPGGTPTSFPGGQSNNNGAVLSYFTGTITSGNQLAVSGVSGTIAVGQYVLSSGGTKIPGGVTIASGGGSNWVLSQSVTNFAGQACFTHQGPCPIVTASVRPLTGGGWWNQANFVSNNLSSGTASGCCQVGGSVKTSEWNARSIPHALTGAYVIGSHGPPVYDLSGGSPSSPDNNEAFVFPARGSDSTFGAVNYRLPEGARLQLDPSLTDSDLQTLGVSSDMLCVCHAMQTYGWYILDIDGNFPAQIKFLSTNTYGSTGFRGPYNNTSALPLALFQSTHLRWVPGPWIGGSSGVGGGVSVTADGNGTCNYTTNWGAADGLVHAGDIVTVYPTYNWATGAGGLQFFSPSGGINTRGWWAGVSYKVLSVAAGQFTLGTLAGGGITSTAGNMNAWFSTNSALDSVDSAIATGYLATGL